MAVPERKEFVEELLKELGDVPVAWENGSGIWDTRCRAMLMRPEDSTHHVVIQDDAILCNNFKEKVEKYVLKYPDCAISLYMGTRDRESFKKNVVPLITDAKENNRDIVDYNWLSWGVGLVLPSNIIQDIIIFWNNKERWLRHDDSRIGTYLVKHNIKLIYTYPSLVDHRESMSIIENKQTTRKAYKFEGRK